MQPANRREIILSGTQFCLLVSCRRCSTPRRTGRLSVRAQSDFDVFIILAVARGLRTPHFKKVPPCYEVPRKVSKRIVQKLDCTHSRAVVVKVINIILYFPKGVGIYRITELPSASQEASYPGIITVDLLFYVAAEDFHYSEGLRPRRLPRLFPSRKGSEAHATDQCGFKP